MYGAMFLISPVTNKHASNPDLTVCANSQPPRAPAAPGRLRVRTWEGKVCPRSQASN